MVKGQTGGLFPAPLVEVLGKLLNPKFVSDHVKIGGAEHLATQYNETASTRSAALLSLDTKKNAIATHQPIDGGDHNPLVMIMCRRYTLYLCLVVASLLSSKSSASNSRDS